MEKYSLIVIDDFYDDPDSIRELALALPFEKRADARYPGTEAISVDTNWESVIQRIQKLVPEPCQYKNIKNFYYPQGKFHLALQGDHCTRNVGVHTDLARWSAVIYLSKEYNPEGGTQWYRHIETGAIEDNENFLNYCFSGMENGSLDNIREAVMNISKNMSQWEKIQSIAMRYNRLVLFRADQFHANNVLFGRLTQHFVFWSDDQSP